jgi:alkylation response protein AidB-like acyl-CoA dehydrogenase
VADRLVCVARSGTGGPTENGIIVLMVDAASRGVACEVMPTLAVNKLCEVRFHNVVVSKEDVLGKPGQGWPVVKSILHKAVLAKCAESLGGMQACVDMTVAYAKERVQYGRPIGAFQALQHIMADMWIAAKTSECLTQEAIWMESERLPCSREASMAKAYVNEAFKNVSKWAIRLHGGVGTSNEHDVSLYYRAAKAADTLLGDTGYHREIVAQALGLGAVQEAHRL